MYSFLPLGATAQGELWPPEQSASILLYSEANPLVSELFSFYSVKLLASRLRLDPTPWPVRHWVTLPVATLLPA
jgi:hypothetical protein